MIKEKIKRDILGSHEIIKRNYENLLIAKQLGLFRDGYDKDNIETCSDWVIALWIDELDEIKNNKEKFKKEVIPTFKRWFNNGTTTNGLGYYYDVLVMAERKGICIDNNIFAFISGLVKINDVKNLKEIDNYESKLTYFKIEDIINNLIKFKNNGIPINYYSANLYDLLLELESKGEKNNYDTFIFFYTARYSSNSEMMDLYETKKYYENKYSYQIFNANEVNRLLGWFGHNDAIGFNLNYIIELENKIKKLNKKIKNSNLINIASYLNKEVAIIYYEFDKDGNKIRKRVKGKLIDFNKDGIKIFHKINDKDEFMFINDNNQSFISKIYYENILIYECKVLKERETIEKLKRKIEEIKSNDVSNKYIEKYGTIEGLAYLKKYGLDFVNVVDKDVYPIDCLFTYCFENIAWISTANVSWKYILDLVKYTYDLVMSGKIDSNINYGYSFDKFLSEETQKVIKKICNFAITETPDVKNTKTKRVILKNENNNKESE